MGHDIRYYFKQIVVIPCVCLWGSLFAFVLVLTTVILRVFVSQLSFSSTRDQSNTHAYTAPKHVRGLFAANTAIAVSTASASTSINSTTKGTVAASTTPFVKKTTPPVWSINIFQLVMLHVKSTMYIVFTFVVVLRRSYFPGSYREKCYRSSFPRRFPRFYNHFDYFNQSRVAFSSRYTAHFFNHPWYIQKSRLRVFGSVYSRHAGKHKNTGRKFYLLANIEHMYRR